MALVEKVKQWLRVLMEVGLLLVAVSILLQILFGPRVGFLPGDVIANLTALIKALGDNGLAGLIALAVIMWLFVRKNPS